MQLLMSSAQLRYTPIDVVARSFSGSVHLHPAGAMNGRDCLKVHPTKEHTMRSFTNYVLPILFAAGVSGLMFTATLA